MKGSIYLVSKNDEAEVVNIIHFILQDVDSVHIHENVSNHYHGCLMIIPCLV